MPIPVIHDGDSLMALTRACRELAEVVRRIEERTKDNTQGWAGNQTNVTVDRSYNANATTTDELADVLGTLISDLLEVGILK